MLWKSACRYNVRNGTLLSRACTPCYAIEPPGRKSGFRAEFRPDSNRENLKSCSPAGLRLRPAGRPILMFSRLESGRNLARKPDFGPGNKIAQHRQHACDDKRARTKQAIWQDSKEASKLASKHTRTLARIHARVHTQ